MGPPSDPVADRIRAAGLRPTRRRVRLGQLLFDLGDHHFVAEDLWRRARDGGVRVSLATVYNTLNAFVEAGLLRVVDLPGDATVFDTNTSHHHHLLDEATGELTDLDPAAVALRVDPSRLPDGVDLVDVDVLVRVRS